MVSCLSSITQKGWPGTTPESWAHKMLERHGAEKLPLTSQVKIGPRLQTLSSLSAEAQLLQTSSGCFLDICVPSPSSNEDSLVTVLMSGLAIRSLVRHWWLIIGP